MVTRGHSDVNLLRDDADGLKRECQELRIDVEERVRKEKEIDRQNDDAQIEYGSLKNRVAE
jgi:chromosome segregation ATPase